ncbi:hypothetical protein JCM10213_001066 [Rhodosporidiobolus nylandii]
MSALRTLQQPLRTTCTRATPAARANLVPSSRTPSTASPARAQRRAASTAAPQPPQASTSAAAEPAAPAASHYLVTLLRSPLHLPKNVAASLSSLGLGKRLSSAVVPITQVNAGYILAAKELVGVRTVSQDQVKQWASREWRERDGEGKQGSGMRVREGATENSVIRVGSERARGAERGFRVVQ